MAETKTLNTRIILRNGTTAEWEASEVIMKVGEVGIDTDKKEIRIGDGTNKWPQLKIAGADQQAIQQLINNAEDKCAYLDVTEANETDDALLATLTDASQGDVAIVRRPITGDKLSYTAYVYAENKTWKAMDGNYSAKNVYFDSDFTYTNAIGAIGAPSGGSGKLTATGKNVEEFLASILAKEANPTTTQPAASVKITSGNGTFEIGTRKNIAYTASLSAGKYTYGPATGVVAGTVTASFDGKTLTGATGTFENIVADGTKELSVSIEHNEGAVPKTNLGNNYAAGKIAAGTKTAKASEKLIGVRHMFYGPMTTDAELTSENIRELTHNQAKTGTISTFGAGAGAVKVVIAVPSSMKVTKVLMPSAMNADATASFVKQAGTVQVEGAEGFAAAAYNVWVYKPASIDKTETYSVTIG